MNKIQLRVAEEYRARGYSSDLTILALGLCEEAGEVAGAVLNLNPVFKKREGRSHDSLRHELKDCLTYLCAIATAIGIDIDDLI